MSRNKTGGSLFTPDGAVRVEKLINDTERRLENTRKFLDDLREAPPEARRYVDGLKTTLEHEVRRLEREREEKEEE